MAIGENSRLVFDYVKAHDGEDFTATEMATALNLGVKTVNGCVTAFQKKKMMYREEIEVELEGGKPGTIKFIRLTDLGRDFDPDAPVEEKK